MKCCRKRHLRACAECLPHRLHSQLHRSFGVNDSIGRPLFLPAMCCADGVYLAPEAGEVAEELDGLGSQLKLLPGKKDRSERPTFPLGSRKAPCRPASSFPPSFLWGGEVGSGGRRQEAPLALGASPAAVARALPATRSPNYATASLPPRQLSGSPPPPPPPLGPWGSEPGTGGGRGGDGGGPE